MNYKQMEYFISVADNKSISIAAEQCHISPQAISKAMLNWEKKYQQPLFDRKHKKLLLTPFGEIIYQEFSLLIHQKEASDKRIDDFKNHEKQIIKIGFAHGTFHVLYKSIYKEYLKKNPCIQIDYIEGSDSEVESLLEQQELPLIFGINISDNPLYRSTPCFQSSLCIAVSNKHPLAEFNNVSIQDISKYSIVTRTNEYKSSNLLDREARNQGVSLKYTLQTNDDFLWKDIIEDNKTVGITLSHYISSDISDLVFIPLMDGSLKWNVVASYNNHMNDIHARKLFEYLEETI